MTAGIDDSPLGRTLFRLAAPVLIEQLLTYCVELTDTYLAGRLVANPTEATNAVGVAGYVLWLGTLMFGLVGIGTAAVVARLWGAGRRQHANRVANQAVTLAAGLGVIFFAFFLPVAPAVAAALGLTGDAGAVAVRFLRIDAIGLPFLSVTLAAAASFRATGDMRTPMLVLGLVNAVNVAASVSLASGAGLWRPLGVDGIAAGTVLARIVGAAVMLAAFARRSGGLRLRRRLLRPNRKVAARIAAVGLPAAADGALLWAGHFAFLGIVSHLAAGRAGATILAAHVVGVRVEAITYLPAVAWGAAAATVVGQSLGAGRIDQARTAGHVAVRQCSAVAAILGGVFVVAAGPIFRLMHSDPAVWAAGVPALRLLGFFQVPLALSLVYVAALRGAGDTRTPMLFTALCVFGVRLPLSYLAGVVLGGGLVGAWVGMCGDITLRAVLVTLRYSRGKWVGMRV